MDRATTGRAPAGEPPRRRRRERHRRRHRVYKSNVRVYHLWQIAVAIGVGVIGVWLAIHWLVERPQ